MSVISCVKGSWIFFNDPIRHLFYYLYQVVILHIFNNLHGYGKFQAQDLQNSFLHDCPPTSFPGHFPCCPNGGGKKIGTKRKTKDF